MSWHDAVDYWRDRERVALHCQMELDAELTQARCRAGRASAENAAIALAAHALLNELGTNPSEKLEPLVTDLQAALDGAYTQGINCAVGNAVSVYDAVGVIRRMLEKMSTGETMTRAAVKWATQQMLRKRIDLVKIQKWTKGGS